MPVTSPWRPRPRTAPSCQTVISPLTVPAIVSLPLTAYAQLVAPAGAGRSARLPFAYTMTTRLVSVHRAAANDGALRVDGQRPRHPSGVMSTTVNRSRSHLPPRAADAASAAAIRLNPLPIPGTPLIARFESTSGFVSIRGRA